ncbi:MAG: tetratricopeptide repeat protein [Steroidobacteraceae bacterium]
MSAIRTTRNVALLAVTTATALLIGGCGGARSRLATHMTRGQEYFQNGNFAKANVEFRNAMQIDPKDPQPRIMAAETAEKLGQLQSAYSLLQSVLDEHADNDVARTELGRLLIGARDPKRTLEAIKPGLLRHPDDAPMLALRAAAKSLLDDIAAARDDADHALRVDPRNEDAIDVRAGLYRQTGDLPAAIKLVSAAAIAQPATPSFHQVLFSLYQAAKQPEPAEAQLRELVKLKPDEINYRAQLALFLSRSNRLDEAQKALDDAVSAAPHNDQLKLLRVDFLVRERSPELGEQALRRYIAADPDNYTLRLALGAQLQAVGEIDKAALVYGDIVKSADTEANGLIARNRLAAIAARRNHDADAENLLAQVLKASPRDADALALRGQLELARDDSTDAIADFRAILRDQPRSAVIDNLLAQALISHGETGLAEEPLRAAVAAAPGDSALRISLAHLLFVLRHQDQGIAVLQDGTSAAPTDGALNAALVDAYLAQKDTAAAAKVAEQYRQANPDEVAPYLLSAKIARADNRVNDAQALLEKAVSAHPRDYDGLSALSTLEFEHGQAAKAVARLQGLMAADPKDATIPNLLGELYLRQRDFQDAQQVLAVAIANQPKWVMAQRNLALSKVGAGDLPGAIETYRNALALAPADGTMLAELGTVYQRAARVEDARKLYESWVAAEPKSKVAANNLAMLLVSYHSDRASLDRAQALTAGFANVRSGDLLDTAGWVQFKRGEFAQAVTVLQRAVALMPQSREVHYHLGMAELRSGQPERARTDLETALTGSARFVGADDARAALATLKGRAS